MVIMLMSIYLIRMERVMKSQATSVATTPPKRRKRPSSFDYEPIFIRDWRMRFRKWHVRKWLRVYQRGYTHIPIRTFTYHTHAVLPERVWARVFAPTRRRE